MTQIEHEIEIEATPEEIWEAIATDEGRERWLGDPEGSRADREVVVEVVEEPSRLVWWWVGEEAWSRVEVRLVPAVSATRVIVTESLPAFPLTALALSFMGVAA
jgi:uncharacterized protein YndB with AHSA1/START domain